MTVMDVDEALACILAQTKRAAMQHVPLSEAGGRILAKDVVARLTQPPFAASAMDGYAVRAQDVQIFGTQLQIIGEAAAGRLYEGEVGQGQAVRIFTGAPIPRGADTVVIQEDTTLFKKNLVKINHILEINKNIRPSGGDFCANDTVLKAGHVLTPAALALCAAAGHDALDVVARPRVGILSTGDELVEAGCVPQAGQIVASNAHALVEIVRSHGGEAVNLGIVRDEEQVIKQAIEAAQAQGIDILLTIGGVSVGAYDLVQQVLRTVGMQLDFWKIAMRPGKPLMFGRLPADHHQNKEILVLGLPGNPVSSIVTAHLFLVPMLEKMAGYPLSFTLHEAILTAPLGANGSRRHYIRAHMTQTRGGDRLVTPDPNVDSSLLSVLVRANCLIVVPENAPAQQAGSRCHIFMPKGGL